MIALPDRLALRPKEAAEALETVYAGRAIARLKVSGRVGVKNVYDPAWGVGK